MNTTRPKRLPDNPNLHYWYDDSYDGYSLMVNKGPFIVECLEKLYTTLQHAFADYSRVFAFRFDLRLPCGQPLPDDAMTNKVLHRFKASFDAQIEHSRKCARSRNRSAHDSCVRYFWVREVGGKGRPHYHCIVFLNGNAYRSLGHLESEGINMHSRLQLAWARALRLPVSDVRRAVHIPKKATFHLTRRDYFGHDRFMYRSSYLCKAATKSYENGQHGHGGSRC